MDPQRFDRLSKTVANNLSQREAVGGIGIAGFLAATVPRLGGVRRAEAAAAKTCTYSFEATIVVGPSSEDDETSTISGELQLSIASDSIA